MSETNKPRLIMEFHETMEKSTLKLTKCVPLDQLPVGDVREAVQYGYQSTDLIDNTIAVLINAIVSSKKPSFILSRSLLVDLFIKDPNIDRKTLSGEQMRRINGVITGVGLVERTSQASKRGGHDRKAAIYKVIHKDVLKLIEEEQPSQKPS